MIETTQFNAANVEVIQGIFKGESKPSKINNRCSIFDIPMFSVNIQQQNRRLQNFEVLGINTNAAGNAAALFVN